MLRILLKLLFMAGVCFSIYGCDTIEPSVLNSSDFPEPSLIKAGVTTVKLVPGNTLEISVEVDGKMEVSLHRASISHAGYATLPLVGDVKVGGLYIDGARNHISTTYGRYFVNPPVVMISLIEEPGTGEWGFVTVTGRVASPGRVKVASANGMKLTSVIQEAGGFAPSAKKSDIRVTRVEQDGAKKRVSVNYDEIGQDGNIEADLNLKDGDIVYIPERLF